MKAGTRLIDAHAVHDMTGISVYTIRRMARRGEIPARKVGTATRFVVTEIEDWFAGLPKASA